MKGLSPKQKQVLAILEDAVTLGEHLTVREIGDRIGVSSTCTVHQHLKALERKGYLKPANHKHRSIQLTSSPQPFISVPFCGEAAAGAPAETHTPSAMDSMLLTSDLVGPGECVMYQVRGNSMAGAAICHGDLVVVQTNEESADGDVVVATVQGEAIIKRLFHEDGRVSLHSEHPDIAPIYPEENSKIVGRVSLVIRRL